MVTRTTWRARHRGEREEGVTQHHSKLRLGRRPLVCARARARASLKRLGTTFECTIVHHCASSMTRNHRGLFAVVALTALAAVRAEITTAVGARAAKSAKLQQPAGVATLLRNGALHTWVADTQNNRIQYVNEAGDVETVAGTGEFSYFGDGGNAADAKFAWPHGIAVRDACDAVAQGAQAGSALYIADTYNHRVRRVVDGRIETVAGTGKRGFRGDGGAATAEAA
ncbi:hypothetical protein EON66_03565, partial [archaeon]